MALFEKLGKYQDFGLLVMRAGIGFMMITHGLPKITGGPHMWADIGQTMDHIGVHFAYTFWGFMAALAEALGGVFLVLGLFFRPACLFLLFTMAMAATEHFASGGGLKEAGHALELGFVFFGLVFIGPGRFSVDKS